MEDKKVLNNEELEKVAGGTCSGYYELKFQCNKCGDVYYIPCYSDLDTKKEEVENSQCLVCDGSYVYVDATWISGPDRPYPIYP